jgi:hypothetical protein
MAQICVIEQNCRLRYKNSMKSYRRGNYGTKLQISPL